MSPIPELGQPRRVVDRVLQVEQNVAHALGRHMPDTRNAIKIYISRVIDVDQELKPIVLMAYNALHENLGNYR